MSLLMLLIGIWLVCLLILSIIIYYVLHYKKNIFKIDMKYTKSFEAVIASYMYDGWLLTHDVKIPIKEWPDGTVEEHTEIYRANEYTSEVQNLKVDKVIVAHLYSDRWIDIDNVDNVLDYKYSINHTVYKLKLKGKLHMLYYLIRYRRYVLLIKYSLEHLQTLLTKGE